jgi:hypothetical protein
MGQRLPAHAEQQDEGREATAHGRQSNGGDSWSAWGRPQGWGTGGRAWGDFYTVRPLNFEPDHVFACPPRHFLIVAAIAAILALPLDHSILAAGQVASLAAAIVLIGAILLATPRWALRFRQSS